MVKKKNNKEIFQINFIKYNLMCEINSKFYPQACIPKQYRCPLLSFFQLARQ